MKRFLAILCYMAAPTWAAPSIVSDADVSKSADKCVYQEGTAVAVETPLVLGGCKIDLAGFIAGGHSLQVWFRSSLWGVDSAKVPFQFSKPSAGGIGPTNLLLAP